MLNEKRLASASRRNQRQKNVLPVEDRKFVGKLTAIDACYFSLRNPLLQIRSYRGGLEDRALVETANPHPTTQRFALRRILSRSKEWSLDEDVDLVFRLELQPLETVDGDARVSKDLHMFGILSLGLRRSDRLELANELVSKAFSFE